MSTAEPQISIIVPARDGAGTIARQLEALADQSTSRPYEVIVVDNGSSDATAAVARSFADRLERLVVDTADGSVGCGYARNVGARAARGELLAFSDSDDVAHVDWLEALARAWEPGTLVAGRIHPLRSVPVTGYRERVVGGTTRNPIRGFLPFADGCNMAIGRHDFEVSGGFDESFRFSQDIELSWRVQLEGLRFVDAPDAVVFKQWAPQGWARFRQFHRWGQAGPRLYRQFRADGLRPRPPRTVARAWAALGLHLVRAPFHERDRQLVVSQAGFGTGMAVGSLRQRVLYL